MERLGPEEWVSISFTAPRLPRLVEVVIDADWIVDAWAMPADELDAYAVDGDFDYYEARRMRQGAIRFTPDGGREWVLVLSNPNGFDVHVHYDVIW